MAENQNPETESKPNRVRARRVKTAVWVCVVAGLMSGVYWWLFMRNRVTTDDAYAKVDPAPISARVPGTVIRVLVENDRRVEEGRVLVELDPTDYRVAVERAQAALNQNEAEVRAAEISVPLTDAQTSGQARAAEAALKAARDAESQARHRLGELKNTRSAVAADLAQFQRDFERFDNLYKTGAGTRRQQEQALTALRKAQAQLAAADSQILATEASLAAATQQVDRARAQFQVAQSDRDNVEIQQYRLASLRAGRDKSSAELEAARLNLSYCTITAPIDGFIAQKSVQVGARVQPGQPLMAVVPLQDIYVEANYKETQLKNVRLGQPASIRADIYPGWSYTGKVAGIRAGTGAAFSLIPAENATGNWIKVVQRVPVRILLDRPPPRDHPLRLGLSLVVTVDTSDRSGPVLMADTVKPPSNAAP